MNYYPFHIGDYLSATRHLSWEEDAAYRRLLDVYYTTEKPLPLELRQVWRLVLATTDTQREAVQIVLDEFFMKTESGWVNTRADVEIDAMREKQQKQRDKANKRWHKPESEPGIASALPQHNQTDATASEKDANAMPPTPTPTPTPVLINTSRLSPASPPADADGLDLVGHKLNGHAPKTVPDCPHAELLALWAEVMPDLPQHDPSLWPESARATNLRARWRSTAALKGWATKDEGLAYFRKLFQWCRRSDFLMGKAQSRDRRPFQFELAWLVNATNWTKVHEGKFNE